MIVRTFCESDLKAFALLSLYFRIAVERNFEKMEVGRVEKVMFEGLEMLVKDYKVSREGDEMLLETTKVKLDEVEVQ